MPNPFPGMNPYMERPIQWRSVHRRLLRALDEEIRAQLDDSFFVTFEERLYPELTQEQVPPDSARIPKKSLSNSSDNAFLRPAADPPLRISIPYEEEEGVFLTVCQHSEPERVVTVVEVLSPKVKSRESHWRSVYLAAQREYLTGNCHFLEIDLLRNGVYTLAAPYDEVKIHRDEGWDYGVSLHRAMEGSQYEVWLTMICERLPYILLPLTPEYPDLVIDMNKLVASAYERGSYARTIDYSKEPTPPLSKEDALWMDELLHGQGLR